MRHRATWIFAVACVVASSGGCAWFESKRSSASHLPVDPESVLKRLAAVPAECNPTPDPKLAQQVVGYGSLMQDESRKRTAPGAGPALPVVVRGFRRGWFARGDSAGFETTYLGAVPEAKSELNAVVYHLKLAELKATDERESFYCRRAVDPAAITMLTAPDGELVPGQVWIYVNRPAGIGIPSDRFPIVQSYVDIFLSGCLEQEEHHRLAGFARQCVATTSDWSKSWVNDRIYPRRPFIYEPKARQIDRLLSELLPTQFKAIRIESASVSGVSSKLPRANVN